MCGYKKIDLENWCRKEHYLYYTNSLNVEVNMTANIDVSELLTFCHTNGYKFYPTFACLKIKMEIYVCGIL